MSALDFGDALLPVLVAKTLKYVSPRPLRFRPQRAELTGSVIANERSTDSTRYGSPNADLPGRRRVRYGRGIGLHELWAPWQARQRHSLHADTPQVEPRLAVP